MALPSETTAFNQYIDDLLFTGAYLSSTKGLAAHGKRVLEARKKVQQQVAARNERSDERVLAEVAKAVAWYAVSEPLQSFERQVVAHFDSDRVGFGKVFGSKSSLLLRLSESAREKPFLAVVAFARKSGHQGKLGVAAREFHAVWTEYAAAVTQSAGAEKNLSAAIGAVTVAKRQGVVVMRETEGTLRTRFAETPREWRKFFQTRARRSGKKPEAAPKGDEKSAPTRSTTPKGAEKSAPPTPSPKV